MIGSPKLELRACSFSACFKGGSSSLRSRSLVLRRTGDSASSLPAVKGSACSLRSPLTAGPSLGWKRRVTQAGRTFVHPAQRCVAQERFPAHPGKRESRHGGLVVGFSF